MRDKKPEMGKSILSPDDYGMYLDYPDEPIGGDNPYRRCIACGASAPQINGTLKGHFEGCSWAAKKKLATQFKLVLVSD